METDIELGDLAQDMITGYKGVVVGMTKHLTGCDRFTLQAQGVDKDGKIPDAYNFDVTTVKVLQKRAVVPTLQYAAVPGSPAPVAPEVRPGGPPTVAKRDA